jgi:phage-related protein
MNESWNLTFNNRQLSTIDTLVSFLEGKGGVTSFTWQPPGEAAEIKVICRDWALDIPQFTGTNSTSVGSLNATFERVYE